VRDCATENIGRLDDPRNLKEFITIPAGTYAYQKGTVNLKEAFSLSKYPVTNGWFREFVEDKGYENRKLWVEIGWKWKENENITEPRYWHDEKWNGLSFPVVGVSWYEAKAFCRWLNSFKDDYTYDLPHEHCWEAAARGKNGREYPWGDSTDQLEERLNCWEVGLKRTSPVGMFPKGDTPAGILDMAGNVWEWCKNWFDEHQYDRVLRSGGWNNDAKYCTAAPRNGLDPEFRGDIVGFRLFRSP